jgi:hypothetical protein
MSDGGGVLLQQTQQRRPQAYWTSESGVQRPGTGGPAGNVYVAQQKAWLRLQRHSEVEQPAGREKQQQQQQQQEAAGK